MMIDCYLFLVLIVRDWLYWRKYFYFLFNFFLLSKMYEYQRNQLHAILSFPLHEKVCLVIFQQRPLYWFSVCYWQVFFFWKAVELYSKNVVTLLFQKLFSLLFRSQNVFVVWKYLSSLLAIYKVSQVDMFVAFVQCVHSKWHIDRFAYYFLIHLISHLQPAVFCLLDNSVMWDSFSPRPRVETHPHTPSFVWPWSDLY